MDCFVAMVEEIISSDFAWCVDIMVPYDTPFKELAHYSVSDSIMCTLQICHHEYANKIKGLNIIKPYAVRVGTDCHTYETGRYDTFEEAQEARELLIVKIKSIMDMYKKSEC